jgi:hypothetical protein
LCRGLLGPERRELRDKAKKLGTNVKSSIWAGGTQGILPTVLMAIMG